MYTKPQGNRVVVPDSTVHKDPSDRAHFWERPSVEETDAARIKRATEEAEAERKKHVKE
jgi:hypothetical protein